MRGEEGADGRGQRLKMVLSQTASRKTEQQQPQPRIKSDSIKTCIRTARPQESDPNVPPLSLLLESGGKRCEAADFLYLLLMRGSTSRRPHRPRRARRTHPLTTQPSFLYASQSFNTGKQARRQGRIQAIDEGSRRRSTWSARRERDGSRMRFICLRACRRPRSSRREGREERESVNKQAKVGHQGRCSAAK